MARGVRAATITVVEGWAYASADRTQVACCSDTPGGEGRGYSMVPTWSYRDDDRYPLNRPCLDGPDSSTRVRMGVVDPDGGNPSGTVVWVECLSGPEPIG